MNGKKGWKKTGFGVLFVAACFAAMYILMAFYGNIIMVTLAAIVLLVTAFLFLNEVFSDKSKKWMQPEEDGPEAFKETVSVGTDGEFRLKISKHMKEMESTQKELIDVLKNQNALLQNQMENMEQAIFTLSERQSNQTKSVIKFNKENARQLAISERETLEYVMSELKKAIEDSAGAVVERASVTDAEPEFAAVESAFAAEEPEEDAPVLQMEEIGNEGLFEVTELPGDEDYTIPEIPVLEEPVVEEPVVEEPIFEEPVLEEPVAEEPEAEFEIPDMPDDIDLSALFEDMAAGALEEAEEEPLSDFPTLEDLPLPEDIIPVEEPSAEEITPAEEPKADPMAGLGGDPNAMMTPEDIAKLLASMGQ